MKFMTLDRENQKQSKMSFRRARNQLFAVYYEENAICAVNTYRYFFIKECFCRVGEVN
jgi:hypothetical protein